MKLFHWRVKIGNNNLPHKGHTITCTEPNTLCTVMKLNSRLRNLCDQNANIHTREGRKLSMNINSLS